MELLIAILIALGSLTNPDSFTREYELQHQQEIEQAQYIMDNEQYTRSSDGGVVVNENIDF